MIATEYIDWSAITNTRTALVMIVIKEQQQKHLQYHTRTHISIYLIKAFVYLP